MRIYVVRLQKVSLLGILKLFVLKTFIEVVCDVEYDTGSYVDNKPHSARFFYKKDAENCFLFTYYGARGNANKYVVCSGLISKYNKFE